MSTYTQQTETAPLARSNSFFGAIKNIVTAPFTWFAGSEDDFEDTKGKRRRLPVISEESRIEDEGLQSRAKRMRVSSPSRDTQPYLDPPRSAFAQPRRTSDHASSNVARDVSRSPRKTLHVPRTSSISNRLPRNRRTVSPLPSGSHLKPQGMTRTMSLDPPSFSSFSSRIQAVPTIQDLQPDSNRTREEVPVSRDVSMSPRHLRVRSSLTPQPSGPSFGPVVPPRRERGPDEPPPLTALMSNPTFVKPPPGTQKQNGAEPQKQLTLGSLVDQRRAHTPARQSSILFGTGSMTDVSARHLWPVNKAEVALHELEVYKTPLLPTRLKGSTTIPDMFMHKGKKHITLMNDDRPSKPRLGTKSKGKEKGKGKKKDREATNGTKPYAGEGGMKKWLARRKKEEEEAKEEEEVDAMQDEKAEEEQKRKEAEAEKKKREEELRIPPPPPAAPLFEPRVAREGPLTSSLRVGRARTGRNHIERPVSRRAKFSAAFEDEDEEMDESRATEQQALEEAAKKAPVFEISAGFTFAKETNITHDLTHAKEPPIPSLPFSLAKPTPVPAPVLAPTTAEPAKTAPAPPAPIPVLPTISLVPPTPEAAKIASESPAAPAVPATSSGATLAPPATIPSGIPNFFASSSIFAKPTAVPTSPSLSLVPSTEERPKPAATLEVPAPKVPEAPPSLFGAASRPVSAFGAPASVPAATTSIFGAPPAPPKEAEKPATPAPTLAPAFTFGAPAKPVEPAPAPPPAPAPSQSPAPPQAAEPSKTPAPSGSPFAFSAPPPAPAAPVTAAEAPKSLFTFGQPAPAATTAPTGAPAAAPVTAEPPKSLFGTPPPSTPFSFGPRPSTAPAEEKPTSSAFSLGTPSAAEKRPSTGFSFGAPSTPAAAPAATTPFGFGTPSGTAAPDVSSKPFAFGATTPARPATPPKVEQEVMMDESPARDMILNGNGKAPERPTLNFAFNTPSTSGSALFAQSPATTAPAFSFGSAGATANPFAKEERKETKPAVSFGGFGQTTSTGFGFGQKPPESPATTAAPFQFAAQPSPNVAPASPFTFGAPAPAAAPFGQASTSSAPSSPSTFNRPTPFGFGTPTTTQPAVSPFTFGPGSQPASPATASTTLPTATTGSTFSFGAGTTGAAAPAAGAGTLFTIGSAPSVDATGARRIKGLPRRGGRR